MPVIGLIMIPKLGTSKEFKYLGIKFYIFLYFLFMMTIPLDLQIAIEVLSILIIPFLPSKSFPQGKQ